MRMQCSWFASSAANLRMGSSPVAIEALHALGRASCLDAELFCQEIMPQLPRSSADIETDEIFSCIVPVVSRLGHVSLHHGESLHQWLAWVLSERFSSDTQRMHTVLRAVMSLIRKVLDIAPSEPALEWATKTLETYLPVGHTCENCAQLCIACQLDSHPGWLATIADTIGQSFRIWCLQQVPNHASARPRSVARVAAPIRTDHFVAFGRFARLLKALLDKAVQTRDRRALGASMRLGRIFADHLNDRLVPFWMADFSSNAGLIASSCALFQKSTRILQRLCAYAKEQRDRSLGSTDAAFEKGAGAFPLPRQRHA
ncbi:Fanconi anemia group D2 protein [Cyanidiococcus yangmingshanensis]|uniref:Fanconi anemia group D2 protein n=1 Tax=Cyanidiococcus yangmingshanensis TaxID=2690220 RepID=A0A7J7IJY7_9RHOD|nr:Fanconi anemia group D2 protein [Cyanidiococcus yangmingshanensis]